MKIAIVTNDGKTVSQHFGRSRYYKIYEMNGSEIKSVEMRQRGVGHFAPGGHNHSDEHHEEESFGNRHGFGAEARGKHAAMAMELADCDVLIAGGMGSGAYQHFRNSGLQVILTDYLNADEAAVAFAKGEIKNLASERTD